MTNETSNIGETGVKSIRVGGMRIAELAFVNFAHVRHQIPLAEDTERQNRIEAVLAGAPKQRVSYLKGRIREAEENIKRINQLRGQQSQMISDYEGEIALCKYRDTEIAKTTDEAKIKELKKKFPPYNVEAMQTQITQCHESIERCDEVVTKEQDSIKEMQGVMTLCEKRDSDLKNLGARLATAGE